jgi:hypothetical protein
MTALLEARQPPNRATRANDPAEYGYLAPEKQAQLIAWIKANFEPADQLLKVNSYKLKHEFEFSPGGFYVCNGAFKGAMLQAGFNLPRAGRRRPNWRFFARRISSN